MQRAATELIVGKRSWVLAMVLILVLALSPACSAFCQTQACQKSATTKQDSGCHHEEQLTTEHSASVRAKVAACSVRDLLFALPESLSTWQSDESTSVSFNSDYSSPSTSVASVFALPGSLEKDTSRLSEFHKSAVRRSCFDSSVVLRI
jgi:hypothetical protein